MLRLTVAILLFALCAAAQTPSYLSCAPATMTAPGTASCTVRLTSIYNGPPGQNIVIASSSASITAPGLVPVQPNVNSVTFTLNVTAVVVPESVTISAMFGGITKNFTIQLIPYNIGTSPGFVSAIQSASYLYCNDAGVTDGYVCSLSPALRGYAAGTTVLFKPNTANTGAATLNINGLGAKPIKQADGVTDPLNSELTAGQRYWLSYDGAVFRIVAGGGSGTGEGLSDPGANGVVTRTALNTTGVASLADIAAALGYTPQNLAQKDQNNGYLGLDSGGLVPRTRLGTGSTGAGEKCLLDNQTWGACGAGGGYQAGTQIVIDTGTTPDTIMVDQSLTPVYYATAGAPGGGCVTGRDFNTNTTNGDFYNCQSGAWHLVASGTPGEVTTITLPYAPFDNINGAVADLNWNAASANLQRSWAFVQKFPSSFNRIAFQVGAGSPNGEFALAVVSANGNTVLANCPWLAISTPGGGVYTCTLGGVVTLEANTSYHVVISTNATNGGFNLRVSGSSDMQYLLHTTGLTDTGAVICDRATAASGSGTAFAIAAPIGACTVQYFAKPMIWFTTE